MSGVDASGQTLAHPAVQVLARYRETFAAAWAMRRELAGPKRLTDEAAFLPAALSLQETPVHPAPRRAMWVLMGLFACALGWSIVGQVDIVAVAPGRVMVSDRSKLIQPLEAGVVRAIPVKDGDRVRAGQLLLELDPTQARADSGSVQEQWQAVSAEVRRLERLLGALAQGELVDADAAPEDAVLLRAEWAEWMGRKARLEAERARRQAEHVTVGGAIERVQATLPIVRQRESDFEALRSEGAVPAHAAQDRTRERIELERDLTTQRARLAEADAALEESRRSLEAEEAVTRRNWSERLAKARVEQAQLAQQSEKTQLRESLTRLLSPVDGVVQQRAVHTPGGVVTPAQPVMVIVPDAGQVVAEVTLPQADVGFIQPGQTAAVKLETFNFTRYGTVPARVQHVSADAVVDDKGQAAFTAMLVFDRDHLVVDGKPVRLSAGMALSAEIQTGRRRVIDFLWSPLVKVGSEGLRER